MTAGVAHAQLADPPDVGLPTTELPDLLLQIVNASLVLVGVLALAFLVYGGFLYITSRGDDQQVQRAKLIITWSIVGIVVIGVAAAVVTFVINAITGGSA